MVHTHRRKHERGNGESELVITDTFFAVDDQDRIVGISDLRHMLNDFL